MGTTIHISEEFRDYIYDRKERDQTYEEWLQERVGYNDE